METSKLLNLTADIVAAHVSNNSVAVGGIAGLVTGVSKALLALSVPAADPEPETKKGVVSLRASIKPDYLVCMVCGAKQRMLRRHVGTAHGMTPAQYLAEYDLPRDYPMTAPNYSKRRGDLARAHGLGRKPAEPVEQLAQKSEVQERKTLKLGFADPAANTADSSQAHQERRSESKDAETPIRDGGSD